MRNLLVIPGISVFISIMLTACATAPAGRPRPLSYSVNLDIGQMIILFPAVTLIFLLLYLLIRFLGRKHTIFRGRILRRVRRLLSLSFFLTLALLLLTLAKTYLDSVLEYRHSPAPWEGSIKGRQAAFSSKFELSVIKANPGTKTATVHALLYFYPNNDSKEPTIREKEFAIQLIYFQKLVSYGILSDNYVQKKVILKKANSNLKNLYAASFDVPFIPKTEIIFGGSNQNLHSGGWGERIVQTSGKQPGVFFPFWKRFPLERFKIQFQINLLDKALLRYANNFRFSIINLSEEFVISKNAGIDKLVFTDHEKELMAKRENGRYSLHVLQEFERHPFRVKLFYMLFGLSVIFALYITTRKGEHFNEVGTLSFIGAAWTIRSILFTGLENEKIIFPSVADITIILVIMAYMVIIALRLLFQHLKEKK